MTEQKAPVIDVREHIRKEYKKCATNPVYFIRKYCVIQHPQRGRIAFDLFKYQEDAVEDFEKYLYNIILKGRQIGISTVVACYALWLMLFHNDKNVLVIATTQPTAKNMITKVKYAFDHLPVWLQVPCTENNKLTLKFKNGSQIGAASAASDAARSLALSLLILDEAAFIRNVQAIWTAALPTLSTGGQAILISTPNGVGNFFHKTYSDAITAQATPELSKDGEVIRFNPIKLDWRVHPERDDKWRAQMGAKQGEREARQEYDAEFIGSGATVIDSDVIEYYATLIENIKPIDYGGVDRNVWVWEYPSLTKKYILCADTARGDGTDFSAFHIIEIVSCTQVAEYKGKIGTTEFGALCIEWATKYNDALLVVERENTGWAVIQTIIDREYKNLFYMSKDRQIIDVFRNISSRYNAEEKKMVPGFGTSAKTRPLIIDKLDTYMRNIDKDLGDMNVVLRSIRLIEELRVFIWDNGKAQAQEGYNDDLVMSLGISLWIRDTALRLQQEGVEITKNSLQNIKRSSVDLPKIYMPGQLQADPYKLQIGTPHDPNQEDLRWLF